MPAVGQWVAPTLDPEELDKRINDLRTVQFWLEQNARLLGATIQALEVQRMTLSTLKTMNVSFGDLTESLKIRMPAAAPAPAEAPVEAPARSFFGAAPAAAPAPTAAADAETPAASSATPAGVIDPMQWWGALTQQFTELAANAMKEGASDAARNLAGSMVKQGMDAASETFKSAAAVPMAAAQSAASAAQTLASSTHGAASPGAARPAAGRPAAKKTAARKRSPRKAG
jgi:hypothetical protein